MSHLHHIGEILKQHQLQYRQKMKLEETVLKVACPERLKDEIIFVMQEIAYDSSENALRENLIYPVLKETWKPFMEHLSIWSQITMETPSQSVTAHYLISKKSEYGKIVMESPYLAVVEVNALNLKQGWVEILPKMLALQQQNPDSTTAIYGIVTNGETWEMSKIEQNVFTKYTQRYDLGDVVRLFDALSYCWSFCKRHANSQILPLDYQPNTAIG